MKKYYVELPLNARVLIDVEANTEEEAIKKAYEECDLQIKTTSTIGYEIEEWGIYEKMMEGNFWYGIIYEAEAEEES